MNAAVRETFDSLDYLSNELDKRLAIAKKYKERQYWISLGQFLIEAKEELRKRAKEFSAACCTKLVGRPNTGFDDWLAEKEISRSTAYRWMAEAKNPEKSLQRQEEQAKRNAEVLELANLYKDLMENKGVILRIPYGDPEADMLIKDIACNINKLSLMGDVTVDDLRMIRAFVAGVAAGAD